MGILAAPLVKAQNLTLEGQTGGFITPTAYVVESAKHQFFSHPAVGYHFINTPDVIGDIHTFSIDNDTGIEVGRAICAKTGTLVRKHHTRLRAALEMLRDHNFQSCAHQLRQRLADFQLLA